jgi:hypothetical protein
MSCVTIVRRRRNRETSDLESVANFAEAFVPYKTIKQLFYTHSIGGCNKKNILDLELALRGLKCKALK